MTQTKTCHRIVVISNAPATQNVEYRERIPKQRTTGQRIVIIRNDEFVASALESILARGGQEGTNEYAGAAPR